MDELLYQNFAKPFFFKMDPERAHHVVMDGMRQAARLPGGTSLLRAMYGVKETNDMAQELWGLHFPNPIGLAAGLDKNAEAVEGFSSIGFGFMEVGTVTPLAQPGNELPRLFRLPPDRALINRMGFNNEGTQQMASRLSALHEHRIPVAANIGKNKMTPNDEAYKDYEKCISSLYPYADFFVVNISSPNTPDLRKLQHGDDLSILLQAVKKQMNVEAERHGKSKAVLVKIAPDVTDEELEYMTAAIMDSGVDGIIATNTTISRDGLTHPNAKETGGLSGIPVKERSTEVIRKVYRQTGGKMPIIGVGGVFDSQDAYDKIRAGASLVEIYTALIYEGPGVNGAIISGLRELLRRDGYSHIREAVGADHS